MRRAFLFSLILIIQTVFPGTVLAHPGSGIVVDQYGNIYFIYSGVGVAKLTPDGKLTYIHQARDGHWLCLDEQGSFSHTHPTYFERITADGVTPALIFAGGGSPVVVGKDGSFYYCGGERGNLDPGAMSLARETPGKAPALFAPSLENILDSLHDGITAMTVAPDGSIYLACWNSVLQVTMHGDVRVLAHPVKIPECDEDPADHRESNRGFPLLRGIAVDSNGDIYVAATSCHAVVKITPDGKKSTILKTERPWSPTGLALHQGEVYVLEYSNANGPATEGWKPRVQKIGMDGKVTTLVSDPARE